MRPQPLSRPVVATVVAGAIGAAVFLASLGIAPLRPSNAGWLFNGGIDPSIHFIGAHMHRFAEWSWPPGAVDTLGHPVGTSVALTDSIPIAALAVKAVSAAWPVRCTRSGDKAKTAPPRPATPACAVVDRTRSAPKTP
jgi:hypothetical protein